MDGSDCIHHLFERQAERAPQAAALDDDGERLTYAELNARASQLARRLRAAGVAAESLVGLLAERSAQMVVALLGVLKAGGAYVPLDPGYPGERLRFLWEDIGQGRPGGGARPPVLLAERHLAGAVPAGEVVFLDEIGMEGEDGKDDKDYQDGGVGPDNLAYVIYTSGSTGRPKGVLVPHRGVVNVIRETRRLFGIGPGDRVLQLASLGFDASVLEIFTALSSGACLVLTRRETLASGETLGRELRAKGITAMAIPPSLLDTVPAADLPALRAVILGGEACSAATAARWAAGRQLVNAYAPTEATIYATTAPCAGDGVAPPPIGRPIAGLSAHLLDLLDPLDADAEPVAAGETGEIYLGGVGVVRGYHNRPALTAERFVPDPFGAPGGRLYRSGDLARALPGGDLVFVGRADTQVKVRGYRIELGEIEAVLGQSPAVQTAVVLAREDGAEGAGKRLVAYVVRRGDAAAGSVSALRDFLARQLPDYMVPAAFVFLDAMPATPTGKVDRKALPAPDRARPELGTAFVAPRTPLEERLARLWGELLGLDLVGVDDDFFSLGGHSLLAGQVVTRLRETLGRELPLRAVFDHPTVAALAARLSAPAAAAGEGRPADRLPPLERAPRDLPDHPIPLSSAQERVWFLNQLAPGAIAYNFQFTIRFAGPLAPGVLERALSELVRRHEVLRTSFPEAGGQPVQAIHPPFPARVPRVDLSALPARQREAVAERLVGQEIRRGFDLARIPLLRWLLMRLDAQDHLLLQVEHHFVHDGWSLAVYLRELKELYTAYHAGLPSPLPEPPVQYADFALWQRRWLQGEVLAGQLAYWKEKLGGSPPPLALPTDRPRPRRLSYRGGALRVDLPPDLYAAVRACSRREGSTLFMTMLAAFYTLLYRYTGQGDILLGSGVANRRLRATEEMVGMVVNTLVLRTALSGDLPFRALLARVRATTLEAHDHQDMPFEKLVEELQPDRDPSRNPLFQVLFSFHDAPVPDLDFAGLSGYLYERHNGSAKSDLNVVVKPLAEQRVGRRPSAGGELLTMVWEYSGDLFERATIERLWGHYQTLLAGIVADGGKRLAELPLLTAAERRQLDAWSGAATAPAPGAETGRPVHALVFARAAQAPGDLAIAGGAGEGERLTYGDLARRAAAVAGRLRAAGVGAGDVVAVSTERSPAAAVAALGVLAAGAAYLPLDPAYPRERLEYMLADSGAAALVVRRGLAGVLPAPGVPVVVIGEGGDLEGAAADGPPVDPQGGDPRELAYVIYTSGSTGRPKGVEIEHAGLAHLVAWHRHEYGVTPADRATLLAGPAFDAAVWELWPYLAAGASIHVPDAETRAAPARLLRWLAEQGITLCFLPTPLAEALLDLEPPAQLALRAVLTGGDRLRRVPDARHPFALVNHYGPTENTVVTTAGVVSGAAAASRGEALPAIGRPIAGTRVHLLDRDLRRVPAGVPGELCAAGAGLARGYRGRPELTAEKLIPDPWSAAPGGRLYRTGDLARWLPDGRIEFLGRLDHQVKIRGFRIELGEIEAVLGEHPAVGEAVVVARSGGAGGASLAAYVVPGPGESADRADELRAFLATRLPDYMVPATFTPLAALPLTANGKVDLRALPEPEMRGSARDGESTAPRTPLEELLAGLWSEVLGVPAVGVHDDFFKLGGHSLIATRMLSRVRDAVQAEVPLAALFEGPTVAELALAVEAALRGASISTASGGRIPRRSAGTPAPLSFAQERLWFLDQLAPGGSAYNIARAFALDGDLDLAALARAVGGIVRRHEALRTTFGAAGGRLGQEIAAELPTAIPVIDLAACPAARRAAETGRLLERAARQPFDLQRGPLLRLLALRAGPRQHLLVLVMHHIVSDGWSMGLFFRELSALYRAPEISALPELPIQYADFAVWQRERLQGETLAGLLVWWQGQLAGAPPRLELPADRPRPPLQSFRGGQEAFPLPPALAAALRELAQRSAATPFILLLAALAALFSRYSGQTDVALGSPIAGRTRSETEGLIGFFVNTLVLRNRWDGDPSFRELLAGARAVTLAAHAHQELPFEKLVAELAPDRTLAQTPLFQVMFALQDAARDTPELAGVAVAPRAVRRDESRFDLEITVVEAAVESAVEEAGGLAILWRYDSDLFDRATVLRLAQCFATLLGGIAAEPGQRLSALPLLAAAEAQQLLVEWNDTRSGPPRELTIGELFAAQVRTRPQATAVVCAGERLTYGELDGRARRLAHRLRAAGVGPEVPVGLCLNRSLEAVVAILAILQAGGAYVPLDPAYPRERLAFLIEDSAVPVLLTVAQHLPALPPRAPLETTGGRRVEVLVLDGDDAGEPSAAAAAGPEAWSTPESLAYVIYTSGSTGRPKGVAVTHRNVVRLVGGGFADFSAAETWLQLAPIAFDASTLEIWGSLLHGGRLVIFPSYSPTLEELGAFIEREEITALWLTAGLFHPMIEGALESFHGVRQLLAGGDVLAAPQVEKALARFPALTLVNGYGPTENTTFTCCHPLRGPQRLAGPVPIGRPIAGTRAVLLDAHLRPLPLGAAGELCAGGDGLARGYLGRPALTAERFVPDPTAGEPGARLYRTGDLARHLPDGRLEFLGRLDHQVKVRGFRVELGEIEAALAAHPGVRAAVVTARDDAPGAPGSKRLAAYIVPDAVPDTAAETPEEAGGVAVPADLHDFLRERLPDYMVPADFVALATLPLGANGKVDRRALPAPDAARGGPAATYVAPETPEERALAGIWSEVLGVDRVGVRDDFFRLGGHSLLAAQVMSRVRRDFAVELPLSSLFQEPTIAGLAESIRRARASGGPARAAKIGRVPRAASVRARPTPGDPGDAGAA